MARGQSSPPTCHILNPKVEFTPGRPLIRKKDSYRVARSPYKTMTRQSGTGRLGIPGDPRTCPGGRVAVNISIFQAFPTFWKAPRFWWRFHPEGIIAARIQMVQENPKYVVKEQQHENNLVSKVTTAYVKRLERRLLLLCDQNMVPQRRVADYKKSAFCGECCVVTSNSQESVTGRCEACIIS